MALPRSVRERQAPPSGGQRQKREQQKRERQKKRKEKKKKKRKRKKQRHSRDEQQSGWKMRRKDKTARLVQEPLVSFYLLLCLVKVSFHR